MKLLSVVGTTASGKTDLAISLANALGGEVISCDALQIYRHMDIGTSKPTRPQRELAVHHMLDCAEVLEPWNAQRYATEARLVIEDCVSRGVLPIVCGGSGMYFRALCHSFSDIPDAPRLSHGEDAYALLLKMDPQTAKRLSPNDTQRIHRALDVTISSGKPMSEYHNGGDNIYDPVCIGYLWDRMALEQRIRERTEWMLKSGLRQETEMLLDMGLTKEDRVMGSIGYKQMVSEILEGQTDTSERIVIATRQYAKRQMTWFAHQESVHWLPDGIAIEDILELWNEKKKEDIPN
jgi:tRNA dimethylallyltransferase